MEGHSGQQSVHAEVVVKTTLSPPTYTSSWISAPHCNGPRAQARTPREKERREQSSRERKLRALQSRHLKGRASKTTPAPHRSPFELGTCIPNTYSWPPLRGRSHLSPEQAQELQSCSPFPAPARGGFHPQAS